MPSRTLNRYPLARYPTAVAIVLLGFLVKEWIERWVGPGPPLIFFVPAVTLSAWLGGLWPGVLATTLASLISTIFYFAPIGSPWIASANDRARLIAFILDGLVTCLTMEWLHRARRQADASRLEAERSRQDTLRAEELVRAIVDNVDAIIYLKNRDLHYLMMNQKLRRIFEADPALGSDQTESVLFPGGVAEEVRANDRRVLREGRAIECVEVIPLEDGPHEYVSLRFPLIDSAGEIYAVGCVSTDITPLKEAQRRAVQSERLAAIGQMSAGLAHEGRNALQRSQSCLEMLEREVEGRPRALDLVAGIQEAQEDLHRLYEEVRGYAAPIILTRKKCRVADLIRDAWERLAQNRAGREARLIERGGGDVSCSVDSFRIVQVFRNLLDNALAAASDPVEIVAEWSEVASATGPAVVIAIRDNGPGLTDEQRCKLFEPFFTTKSHGTGLGMAIVKRIIEAHEGAIEADPDEGRGATIRITLPRDYP